MATDARHRRDLGAAEPRPPQRRSSGALVALGIVLVLVAVAAYWWGRSGESTVETGTAPPSGSGRIESADLLGVPDLKAVWPGPWTVVRTGEPADFDRPLVGCTDAMSPVPDPVGALARWSIHAPPQSDGPALSQVLAAARDPAGAAAAVDRVRGWMTSCPPVRPGESGGTRQAVVLRKLPSVDGFLAQVTWRSEHSEASELVAVGRVASLVVLVSYGEYGPTGLLAIEPDPGPLLAAFDRAVDKARRAG
jgi:hypothetical protein